MRVLLAITALVLMSLTQPTVSPAQDTDETIIVFNLTSDDVWTGQMALGLAQRMVEDGHDVVVFLNVRAVTLANSAVPQHTEAMTGLTAHEMIARLVDGGARVFACGGCTRQAGLDPEDLIDGVVPGNADLRAAMMAPGSRIISY